MTDATDEESWAALISFLRGMLSATNMAVHNPAAIPRVEKETARLLWLAVGLNSAARSESQGLEVIELGETGETRQERTNRNNKVFPVFGNIGCGCCFHFLVCLGVPVCGTCIRGGKGSHSLGCLSRLERIIGMNELSRDNGGWWGYFLPYDLFPVWAES